MEKRAFLFDLDGVIFDTEGQYTVLWDRCGLARGCGLREKDKGADIGADIREAFPGQ